MRIASLCLLIAAILQVAALVLAPGLSPVPLLVGTAIAAMASALVRRAGRPGAWIGFLVACGGVIAAAGYAGAAFGLASLIFWTIFAATAVAVVVLFGKLWRAPKAAKPA